MSQKSRSEFKVIFSQGNTPNQNDFWDFLDSYWNNDEDYLIEEYYGTAGEIRPGYTQIQ